MKLNPFNKKSTAYYDKVKSEYDKLDRELSALRAKRQEAEADAEQKQHRYQELTQHGSMFSSVADERRASLAASEAGNRVSTIKGDIGQLLSRITPLMRIALAPEQVAQAKQTLDNLRKQDRELTADLAKTDSQIAKLNKRVADVEARIAAEIKSASSTLLDAEAEFVVPEALAKLEAEQRIATTSLAGLNARREEILASLAGLPQALREAERIFVACRAVMAEVDLYEQLMPLMGALARASVSRHQDTYSHEPGRFEVEIPADLLASAEADLSAELAAA
jgi:chromosome segregation ATPase